MKIKSTARGHAVSVPVGIAWGTGAAMILTTFLSISAAWLIHKGIAEQNTVGYFAMGILLISSLCGAAVAKEKVKNKRMLVTGLTGLCYFVCLLSATAVFFGGQYTGMGVTGLLILAGSGTAALAGKNGSRRRKKVRFTT